MALNPTVQTILDQFATAGRPAISAGTPAEARRLMEAGRAALGCGPDLHGVEDLAIPTRSGSIRGRLFRPKPDPDGLVVYLHGGGWVLGTIEDFDAVARLLAERSGCAVLLPDYRLAPETPHPGGLHDAIDALLWAAERAPRLLGRCVPPVVAGDSAGANLATVAAAELRGKVDLALQVLLYPVTDCDFDTASYRDPANAGLITRADMVWFFDHYAPEERRREPDVSPLRRSDLVGLPPAHVATAEYDVLRDEGEAYARRLQEAGIPITLKRCEGLPHGFIRLHNLVEAVDGAATEIAEVIGVACRQGGRAEPSRARGVAA